MALVSPRRPRATEEFRALDRLPGESGMDALTRVGDGIVTEAGGSDLRDSRPNKRLPRQLAALVALRAQGFDNHEIAQKLKIKSWTLRMLIAKARREYGWSDLGSKLADEAIPLAIESTIKHLEYEGSAKGVEEGRYQATPAVLRGRGVFQSHSAAKVESTERSLHVLRVEIAIPEGPPGSGVVTGSVLATPRRALPSPSAPVVTDEGNHE